MADYRRSYAVSWAKALGGLDLLTCVPLLLPVL